MADSRAPDMGKAQLPSLAWIEPVVILGTMIASLIINRRRSHEIFDGTASESEDALLEKEDDSSEASGPRSQSRAPYPIAIFNRILQKFPFLVEMFYWALNYVAYRLSKCGAAALHGRVKGTAVVELAQEHGISLLNLEHESPLAPFFFIREIDVQQFFLQNHLGIMTFLNQIYSLVHIPGTVAFISWYYYAAPNHATFAIARRTMTLGNFVAFAVFAFWPCMPPRLLPESYGFADTVRQSGAESVWIGDGKNVNQLAAMPSLHFTYALTVGCTFLWHSGFLQQFFRGKPRDRSFVGMIGFLLSGVFYPALVLLVIVATANHYYLDAVAAAFSVIFCFFANRIWLLLMPLEGLLLRVTRLEKPVPTTGEWRRRKLALDDTLFLDV